MQSRDALEELVHGKGGRASSSILRGNALYYKEKRMEGPVTTPAVRQSPLAILERASAPLAVFACALAGSLVLSAFILLPRLTELEVEGRTHDLPSLRAYHAELEQRIAEAETRRDQLILPIHDPLYTALKEQKRAALSFLAVREELREIAGDTVQQNDAVHIAHMRYRPSEHRVEMNGDVRFIGPRSMTVLAQFVEELSDMPEVVSVEQPRFVREDDLVIGPHSPFSFSLILR